MIYTRFTRAQLSSLGAHFPAAPIQSGPSKNALRMRRQRANRPEHYRQKNREYQRAFRQRQKQKELTHA